MNRTVQLTSWSLVAVTLAMAGIASAQAPLVAVNGIAYDSLHAVPLAGASISIAGTGRTATADPQGRFHFDSLAPGSYRFVMQHDALDSLGMSGVSSLATVSDSRDTVRVALPSFSTLWRAACQTSTPPVDSGMLFGTVTVPKGEKPAANANVAAVWIDVNYDQRTGLNQKRWRLDVLTDSLGNYTLCGVPTSTGVRIWAATDSAMSGLISLLPLANQRVMRKDLLVASGGLSDPNRRGAIAGLVKDDHGMPLRDALIVTDGLPSVRTRANGTFIVRDVPAGTQQIEVRSIGLAPVFETIDVRARDTTRIEIALLKITTLDSVRVKANAVRQQFVADYESRKRQGFGKFLDSASLGTKGTLLAVFGELPSVNVSTPKGSAPQILFPSPKGGGNKCLAGLYIDRVKSDQEDLAMYRPGDFAAIEVYVRALDVPADLGTVMQGAGDNATNMRCGVIVMWTKRGWP
jgi:hypothetical protein